MAGDLFHDILQQRIDDGWKVENWWDESRVPLASIDQRVTDLLSLRGKKAVVTGGAGINLGQACVNRLAGLGADVAVVDLPASVATESGRQRWANPPDASAIASAAAEKWDANVFAVEGDALEWDSAKAVLGECHERLGGIDILVNSAADAVVGDFETMTRANIDRTIRGTLAGTIYASRLVLDYMIPQGSGRIINISSDSGNAVMPLLVLYGSLKAGLTQFTRFLGKEVANMVAFLASDASSAMTGSVVDMGGGLSI